MRAINICVHKAINDAVTDERSSVFIVHFPLSQFFEKITRRTSNQLSNSEFTRFRLPKVIDSIFSKNCPATCRKSVVFPNLSTIFEIDRSHIAHKLNYYTCIGLVRTARFVRLLKFRIAFKKNGVVTQMSLATWTSFGRDVLKKYITRFDHKTVERRASLPK